MKVLCCPLLLTSHQHQLMVCCLLVALQLQSFYLYASVAIVYASSVHVPSAEFGSLLSSVTCCRIIVIKSACSITTNLLINVPSPLTRVEVRLVLE